MKTTISSIICLIRDAFTTVTSRSRLKQLFKTPLYSNAFYLIVTGGVNTVLGFIFWIIAARFYSQEDVGRAGAVISAMSLVAGLSTIGLGTGLIRFLPHTESNANDMINTSLTTGALVSLIGALIFIAGLGLWSPKLIIIQQNYWYLAAFVLFTMVATMGSMIDQVFVAYRRTNFGTIKAFLSSTLELALVAAFALFLHLFGIFASVGIASLIAFVVSIAFLLPKIQTDYRPAFIIKRKIIGETLQFSLANFIADFLWSSPGTILPLIVINLLGAKTNAYFYIAWGIGNGLAIVSNSAATSLFAEGSHEEDKLGSNLWRSLRMVYLILIPAVILVSVLANKLLLLFGSAYSTNGTTLLRLLAFSSLPLAVNISYFTVKRVHRQLKALIVLNILNAGIVLGLSYLLLPRVGILGVGYAYLAAQLVITAIAVTELPRVRNLFSFLRR